MIKEKRQKLSHKSELDSAYYLAIYSTYCGSTENRTLNPQPVDSRYPHFFISNNPEILSLAASVGWSPLFLDLPISEDPVVSAQQAKMAKAVPHLIPQLSGFHYSFYKDDKIEVNTKKINGYIDALNDSNSCVAIRPHPFLSNNVLFEFGQAMLQSRYKSQWSQAIKYIEEELENGYQLECQMYWTSAILRNMRHPDIQSLNNTWYKHIQRCGIECQISFNFIAQKFQSITLLPLDIS